MDIKQFINDFSVKAKYFIAKYEDFKELSGVEKKTRVDNMLLEWALPAIDSIPMNIAFKWCLKRIIKAYLPDLSQIVFDLIKTKIDGITEVWTKD